MRGVPRHFVFLQGMPSPFFPQIAARLRVAGCRTTRINLCFGDFLFWHGPNTVHYRGSYRAWRDYIIRFFDRENVTDLILMGERRRYHREAVAAAQARGIQVTVTDFGYIRPDWITFERDGMTGASRFPRDPEAIRALALSLPMPDLRPRFVDSAFQMAWRDLTHNFAQLLFAWLYPGYRRSDARPHTLIYTPASAWRLFTNSWLKLRADQFVRDLAGSGAPYYVFPLQLDFDFQIIAYSNFDGVGQAIQQVLESFAKYAPADTRLVLKEHPWDPAITRWERIMASHVERLGLHDRVDYLRGGNLDDLVRASRGMVTVNSTAGMRALQLGRPLKALGRAIYDVPGLSFQGSLDEFWIITTPPDAALVTDFLTALAGTVQIRGVFFEASGLGPAVEEAAQRLLDGTVGKPSCLGPPSPDANKAPQKEPVNAL
jgi:capsular polysaccharide export protein